MKIIKEGKSKEEFEADKGEYQYIDDRIYSEYYCKCPNCAKSAYEIKMR